MQIDCFRRSLHWRRVFLISTRHIERIRGAFCDDALYKLTLTFTFTFALLAYFNPDHFWLYRFNSRLLFVFLIFYCCLIVSFVLPFGVIGAYSMMIGVTPDDERMRRDVKNVKQLGDVSALSDVQWKCWTARQRKDSIHGVSKRTGPLLHFQVTTLTPYY